ncbi:mucin-1-like [Acinonyx jubatus]|uniref:Mucin-1-like n=1 Tax=Acinonyx jubatus TaxID=32536 RepID=A0ABM3ND02_ACIJB|nr:mucin-1-like [Acinonyx jubatus]
MPKLAVCARGPTCHRRGLLENGVLHDSSQPHWPSLVVRTWRRGPDSTAALGEALLPRPCEHTTAQSLAQSHGHGLRAKGSMMVDSTCQPAGSFRWKTTALPRGCGEEQAPPPSPPPTRERTHAAGLYPRGADPAEPRSGPHGRPARPASGLQVRGQGCPAAPQAGPHPRFHPPTPPSAGTRALPAAPRASRRGTRAWRGGAGEGPAGDARAGDQPRVPAPKPSAPPAPPPRGVFSAAGARTKPGRPRETSAPGDFLPDPARHHSAPRGGASVPELTRGACACERAQPPARPPARPLPPSPPPPPQGFPPGLPAATGVHLPRISQRRPGRRAHRPCPASRPARAGATSSPLAPARRQRAPAALLTSAGRGRRARAAPHEGAPSPAPAGALTVPRSGRRAALRALAAARSRLPLHSSASAPPPGRPALAPPTRANGRAAPRARPQRWGAAGRGGAGRASPAPGSPSPPAAHRPLPNRDSPASAAAGRKPGAQR